MALTDVAIRNAKPGTKAIKLADGGGMFLLITPAGGKLWRLKFRIDGKERKLALGRYPDLGLADARKERDAARAQMAQGADPAREKQRKKAHSKLSAENTFAAILEGLLQLIIGNIDRAFALADRLGLGGILTVHFHLHLDGLTVGRDHR